MVRLACYAFNATRPRFDTSAVCRPCVVNVECMCFHVLMDMPVPQACRERPTSLRFTASHRRIVASSNCPTSASPSSYCLIAKGPRGVGEQFAVVGFGFGRPSVFVRRGRYLAGVVRMLIPSSTVSLPPPSSTSHGTYQRHPPRKTLPPRLLFLVCSCCLVVLVVCLV